jgi:hypothetical protein
MAFLLFLPLSNHHHTNVNVLFPNIYFPLKISSILYTTTFFVSYMWPYHIYIYFQWILMGKWHYLKKSKKSYVWCYVDRLFKLQKNECLKTYFQSIQECKIWPYIFSNFDSKDCKNTLLHSDQSVSSCVLLSITQFSPTLGVRSRRWITIQVSKQVN